MNSDDVYLEEQMEKLLYEEEMTGKLLKGVTHAIVQMTSKEIATQTGVYGVLFLCFGPDEANAIGQIHLIKSDKRLIWRPPYIDLLVGGQIKKYPVFKGQVQQEIMEWAGSAYDLIKKTFGKGAHGHRYRIANNKVVDETPTEVGTGA